MTQAQAMQVVGSFYLSSQLTSGKLFPKIPLKAETLQVKGMFMFEEPSLPALKPTSMIDPFGLSLGDFRRLNLAATGELHERAGEVMEADLEDAWRRGANQVIVCNGKIIYETRSNEMLSDRVKAESERRNMPCYAFGAPPIIEEFCSPWNQVVGDDHYPTLRLNLSPLDSDNMETNYVSIDADFDTGNPNGKYFDADRVRGLLGDLSPDERIVLRGHPSGPLRGFRKRAKVWVRDETKTIHSAIRDDIMLIENMRNSPLVAYSRNQNRVGFVSRDLLPILNIQVQLDPLMRITRICGT
jgi:hypothetical protein